MRLKNKVAIITGAGKGMGREASVLFAAEGAKIVVFDLDENAGEETVKLVHDAGGHAIFVQGDVSDEAHVENAIANGVEVFDGLDILYANAGVLWKDRDKSVVDTTEEDWDRVQAINLKGPFFLTKHGIPQLKKRGGGSIILIGSISGLLGFKKAQDSYTSAKGALIPLAKSIAIQFAKDNIRCNIIHPGFVETPMQEKYLAEPGFREAVAADIPLGRIGTPRDIANAALFLASDESSFITGAELVVDGGFYAQ